MLAAEVATRSPAAAVQSVLERAVSHASGRHCPLLWRLYLRFEAHRGRHDAVRRWGAAAPAAALAQGATQVVRTCQWLRPCPPLPLLAWLACWHPAAPQPLRSPLDRAPLRSFFCRLFLRAIGACPWAKALWCDGLALMNGHAPPKELSGEGCGWLGGWLAWGGEEAPCSSGAGHSCWHARPKQAAPSCRPARGLLPGRPTTPSMPSRHAVPHLPLPRARSLAPSPVAPSPPRRCTHAAAAHPT